jgi:2-iminobutanoate/2-iminopropanoate deaminase
MQFIHSDHAPKAIGPYSQAIKVGDFIFLSGQIPLNPQTMKIVEGGIFAQTEQVFKNIKAVLEASQCTLGNVVKSEVFLQDLEDFQEMNKVYADSFGGHKPARNTYQVARLPLNSLVEISMVAYKK